MPDVAPLVRLAVKAMPTVESQSLRLWFRPDLAGIGWPDPPPILSGYEMPYCTWEDDGQLVAGETWAEGDVPGAASPLSSGCPGGGGTPFTRRPWPGASGPNG